MRLISLRFWYISFKWGFRHQIEIKTTSISPQAQNVHTRTFCNVCLPSYTFLSSSLIGHNIVSVTVRHLQTLCNIDYFPSHLPPFDLTSLHSSVSLCSPLPPIAPKHAVNLLLFGCFSLLMLSRGLVQRVRKDGGRWDGVQETEKGFRNSERLKKNKWRVRGTGRECFLAK